MLYGQNLPWRLALRHAYRPVFENTYSSTGRSYSLARWRVLSGFSSTSKRRESPVYTSPPSSSTFSTSPARRKDSQDDSKDVPPLETLVEAANEKADIER